MSIHSGLCAQPWTAFDSPTPSFHLWVLQKDFLSKMLHFFVGFKIIQWVFHPHELAFPVHLPLWLQCWSFSRDQTWEQPLCSPTYELWWEYPVTIEVTFNIQQWILWGPVFVGHYKELGCHLQQGIKSSSSLCCPIEALTCLGQELTASPCAPKVLWLAMLSSSVLPNEPDASMSLAL